jgi:asparagine synthase (glutamine-hydrolysing)
VRAFRPSSPSHGLFDTELLRQAGHAEATYAQLAQRHPLSFVLFVQAPWHHYGLLALEQTQLSVRSPYLDNTLVRTVFQSPQSCLGEDTCLRLIAQGDPMLLRIRTDRGRAGGAGWLRRNVSRSFLEFTFKAEFGFDEGMPQWVASIDHAFSRFHLERLFLGRHKFAHYRTWYRNQLSSYVRDVLLDPHSLSRPYVNRNKVEAIVRGHLEEGKNHTGEIHQLLTLELIHRLFVDQSGSCDRTRDINSYLTQPEKSVSALQVH